jgi:hypothetical protein
MEKITSLHQILEATKIALEKRTEEEQTKSTTKMTEEILETSHPSEVSTEHRMIKISPGL